VLLLDEPFSSLDPAVRKVLQEAVRRIQRELGITAVLVTHDRAEALAMADRVALLEGGALIAHDTPRQLYERPPTRSAARQMGVDTFLCGVINGATLHSQLGPIALTGPGFPVGQATIAIRPEHLRLLPHPAPNSVAANVQAQIFRGDYVEYLLSVQSELLRARVYQPISAVGERIYVQFPPEHLFSVIDDLPCSAKKDTNEHP
jgi:ABC-type Fe3+/spermidine/putrescine transport system ATPase subunit